VKFIETGKISFMRAMSRWWEANFIWDQAKFHSSD